MYAAEMTYEHFPKCSTFSICSYGPKVNPAPEELALRFKNLEKYRTGGAGSRMQLKIPLPKTPEGRVYRFSPNEAAEPRHFVLGDVDRPDSITEEMRARMKLEPGSSQTVCPYSGVVAEDEEFTHPDDREAALEIAKHAALSDMEDQISKMFEGIGRRNSRNSMLKIEVKTSKSHRPRPRFYRTDLLRELVCDHCGRDYGVYAIGLFCPDCGAPNLHLHFAREVDLVDAQVQFADGLDTDLEELAYRLLGNAHEDVLTAFEATLKSIYLFGWAAAHPGGPMPRVGNEFQNVERGQRRFAELGFDPYAVLDDLELAAMKLNIQKRHVIGHNLGVIDAKFAQLSDEAGIGETVHLVGEDIRTFANTAKKVIDALDGWLSGVAIAPRARAVVQNAEVDVAGSESSKAAELGLTENAYRLGVWLAENSTLGLACPVDRDGVLSAFEDLPDQDYRDAVAELETDGYIGVRSLLNGPPLLSYRVELFSTFDPFVGGADPTLDAVELARMTLELDQSVDVAALHEKTGWELRRFNPALSVMLTHVDERRVSGSGDGRYATRAFIVVPTDRVQLRRFADRYAKAMK